MMVIMILKNIENQVIIYFGYLINLDDLTTFTFILHTRFDLRKNKFVNVYNNPSVGMVNIYNVI